MKFFPNKNIIREFFQPRQKVLLYNSHLHLFFEKLHSRWSRSFIVHTIHLNEAVEIKNLKNGDVFKVNGQWLKSFLQLKIP